MMKRIPHRNDFLPHTDSSFPEFGNGLHRTLARFKHSEIYLLVACDYFDDANRRNTHGAALFLGHNVVVGEDVFSANPETGAPSLDYPWVENGFPCAFRSRNLPPCICQALRFTQFNRIQRLLDAFASLLRIPSNCFYHWGSGTGEVVPFVRVNGIFQYPAAFLVHSPKFVLSLGVTLLSGLSVPPRHLSIGGRRPKLEDVSKSKSNLDDSPKSVLSVDVALHGGLAIPLLRLLIQNGIEHLHGVYFACLQRPGYLLSGYYFES